MHAKNKKNISVFDQNLLLKLNPEDTIVYEIKDEPIIINKDSYESIKYENISNNIKSIESFENYLDDEDFSNKNIFYKFKTCSNLCTNKGIFEKDELYKYLSYNNKSCPFCKENFKLDSFSNTPPYGTMNINISHDEKWIEIIFSLYGGLNNIGRWHAQTRYAYYPNIDEGYLVIWLLIKAFLVGKLFRIGDSILTGKKNVITYGNIHLKTSKSGGIAYHGYSENPNKDLIDIVLPNLISECNAFDILRVYGKRFDRNGLILSEGGYNKDSKLDGKGKKYDKGKVSEEGIFKNDILNGKGIKYYQGTDKKKLEGFFKDGKLHGLGTTYHLQNEQKFMSGKFKHGRLHGKATETHKDTGIIVFDGYYKDGKRHGEGTEYEYDTGDIVYKGMYKNDEYNGKGKIFFADDGYGINMFKNGNREGKGKTYTKDGTLLFSGMFKKDEKNGYGSSYYADGFGLRYKGNFKNDKYNGKGTLYDFFGFYEVWINSSSWNPFGILRVT